MKNATAVTQEPIQRNFGPKNFWKAIIGELLVNRPRVYSVMMRGIDQANRKKAQARMKLRLPSPELADATIRGNRQMFPVPRTHPRHETTRPKEYEKFFCSCSSFMTTPMLLSLKEPYNNDA